MERAAKPAAAKPVARQGRSSTPAWQERHASKASAAGAGRRDRDDPLFVLKNLTALAVDL